MAWAASDIALIITTSATAFTAVAGFALPLWQDRQSKKHKRNEEAFERLADAVYFCIEHIDDVMERNRDRALEMAALSVGTPYEHANDEAAENTKLVERNRRMIQVMTDDLDLDSREFLAKLVRVSSSCPSFFFKDGELKEDPGNQEKMELSIKTANELAPAASKLLKSAREKLDVG